MRREQLSQVISGIDERQVAEAYRFDPALCSDSPERIVPMSRKRIITFALAAALLLALSAGAYAAWSIHEAKQQELKADLQIAEHNAESYVEFAAVEEGAEGLVLLSAVNDGLEERVYLNVSPVTEEEAAAFPEDLRFFWNIEGTEVGGSAGPQLPVEASVSGTEAIRAAVLAHAYDQETQTMTLQCFLDVDMVKSAAKELGTDAVPLQVGMILGDGEPRYFGPVSFTLTEEQSRYFDFGHAVYHDAELNRDIEIVGLELTPFSAVWKVRYEGAADFHRPEADQEAYGPWSLLEDKVCIESRLIFSDGSDFSTGGALTCPYENGTVNQYCSWGRAIDIGDIQQIVLGDLVLWDANK